MDKLRILQLICPVGFYGAERWILALANNLDSTMVQCDLAVTKENPTQNLQIVENFPTQAGQTFEIEMNGRFDLSAIFKLCDLIRQRRIDIIHTHGYKSDILGLIASKITATKCVSTPHGFGENIDLKLKLFVKLGCFLLRYFDSVAPLSNQLYDEIVAKGVPTKKMTYIQNGVDLSDLNNYIHRNRSSEKRREINLHVGFVGQMIPRKGIADLLIIFNDLWQEDNNLELSLLGDGAQRQELESLAKSLKSCDHIHFLGFRTDRLEIMQSFDLFAMTSTLEGIPRCLMEALAMELPVAAYDIPGVNQLVKNNKTGLLAKVGDRQQLTSYWKKLIYDQEYAHELASAGRQFVEENFSAARMAREYTQLFCKLLDRLPSQ